MIPNLSALVSSQASKKLIQPNLKILTNCIQRTDGNIGGGCFDSPDCEFLYRCRTPLALNWHQHEVT